LPYQFGGAIVLIEKKSLLQSIFGVTEYYFARKIAMCTLPYRAEKLSIAKLKTLPPLRGGAGCSGKKNNILIGVSFFRHVCLAR
jgi:hypothetical protein